MAERFGLATDLRWLRAERVFQAYWQGDWAAARHDADQFITEAAESPHFMERACRQVRALIRLAVGDPPGALGDATTAVDLATQVAFPEALWPALALHAHVLLAGGRAGEAGTRADELLGELAERGALPTNPDWSGQLAVVLFDLGRTAELTEVVAGAMPTPWLQAATSIAAGDFVTAADRYAGIGSLPDEAFARLRAAERLLAAGRRVDGNAQLQRALAFYRRVDATAYLRQGEALVAASA